ncbi:hypothetical protein HY477_01645 [Candidatus Uhrbacteria bacterium]|nr:hypothetical protein [Candidatus Uhrbacteria bacterium]
MRNAISSILFAFVCVLAIGGNANAQPAPSAPINPFAYLVAAPAPAADKPLMELKCNAPGASSCDAQLIVNGPVAGITPPAPAAQPAPAVTPPPAPAPAPVVVTDAESCSVGWCPLTTVASWVAGIGGILLETVIVLGLLALVAGAVYYFLVRRYERRHDRAWHRRAASLRGWYESAVEAARQEGLDPAAQTVWRRRARRRYGRLLGHHEAAGAVPGINEVPVPPPLQWTGDDAEDHDEPPA